jgi:hypothetical protein
VAGFWGEESAPSVQYRMVRPMLGERREEEHTRSSAGAHERRAVERLLVLALLRSDHVERWSQAELERELAGTLAREVEAALRGLATKGLACIEAEHAWASLPTRALDDLDMICI